MHGISLAQQGEFRIHLEGASQALLLYLSCLNPNPKPSYPIYHACEEPLRCIWHVYAVLLLWHDSVSSCKNIVHVHAIYAPTECMATSRAVTISSATDWRQVHVWRRDRTNNGQLLGAARTSVYTYGTYRTCRR